MIGQCPVCKAYLLRSQMLVRGDHGWRVLVCSASCGARLEPLRPQSSREVEQLEHWHALAAPDAPVP